MPYADIKDQRRWQRERNASIRTAWLRANGPCRRCGSWEDLHVDHVDPGLKVSHKVWSWSPERRAVELRKCQVLCVDCHKEKTRSEAWRPLAHGTRGGYDRGCRCASCREHQSNRMKTYKAAKA